MTLEMRGLTQKLTDFLGEQIADRGPVTERELWGMAMEFFTPQLQGASENLIKNYRVMYGRKIGRKTAERNIINNFRLLLSEVKQNLLHTEKPVILDRKHHGRLFYTQGQEGRLGDKVRGIVRDTGSRADEVLKGVVRGPFAITPSHRKAAEMLEHYGLVETRMLGGIRHAVATGFVGMIGMEEGKPGGRVGDFPPDFRVWRPFRAGVWLLRDGPEQRSLKFDVAAWDPENHIFYLGVKKKYVGRTDLMSFRERAGMLHLPAKLMIFCEQASEEAEKYAKSWGIEIRMSAGDGMVTRRENKRSPERGGE